jgi:hypothetical protein
MAFVLPAARPNCVQINRFNSFPKFFITNNCSNLVFMFIRYYSLYQTSGFPVFGGYLKFWIIGSAGIPAILEFSMSRSPFISKLKLPSVAPSSITPS